MLIIKLKTINFERSRERHFYMHSKLNVNLFVVKYLNMNEVKKQVKFVSSEFKGKYFKVSHQGMYAEAIAMLKKPRQGIRKIDKKYYEVLSTGEIKEYKQNKTKQKDSIYKTMERLRGIIRCNITGAKNELFITLTYDENMRDKERLYNDYEKFYKRLKRRFPECEFLYISVAEPQDRGAWHFHVLLKDLKHKNLYITNKTIRELWKQGWTKTERIKSKEPSEYFMTYFQNDEPHSWEKKNKRTEKKKRKHDRLKYYPQGFNFYRTSRNIKRPVIEKNIPLEKLEKEYPLLTRKNSTDIINIESKEVLNSMEKQTRKKYINRSKLTY